MTKKIFISLFMCFYTLLCIAQNDGADAQLANEYFSAKEYAKASVLYEKLYKKNNSKFFFEYYIKCLLELQEYEQAEKSVKKMIDRRNPDLTYNVILGNVYKAKGDQKQSEEQFKLAIKNLNSDINQILSVSNAFISIQEYEKAEQTYLKGRDLTGNNFYMELASVYAAQRKSQQMIDTYLDLIATDDRYTSTVQNLMQYYVVNDIDGEFSRLLKTSLLKRIQRNANQVVFNELLIWFFIQQKDFKSALVQAKAIDKRNGEDGKRIIDIATLAMSNKEYDIASDAYTYVVQKGSDYTYYYESSFGVLNVLYIKVTEGIIKSPTEIKELEQKYLSTINNFGISTQTIQLIRDLAHLQAFYLNKQSEALQLLAKAIEIRNLPLQMKGICLIENGDVLLLQNKVWDATLAYAQAELDNKNNPTGDEAKFKKAKLAFFTGDFKWAEAQLDVLKASTSKLIANDAFEISQLIKDNINDDSLELPLRMYARSELAKMQNNDSLTISVLDSLLTQYPTHNLADEALFSKAGIARKNHKFVLATEYYQQILDKFGWDILADRSMFFMADIYENNLNEKEKAMQLYKDFIVKFPGSIYVVEARKRFRTLRGN